MTTQGRPRKDVIVSSPVAMHIGATVTWFPAERWVFMITRMVSADRKDVKEERYSGIPMSGQGSTCVTLSAAL